MMKILNDIQKRYPEQKQFHQTVTETFKDLEKFLERNEEYQEFKIFERLCEPDRTIQFRVTWQDGSGAFHINRAWRVQYSNAIGPYKGGLRFHPSANLDSFKFLGFEQMLKNALTGLQLGGAKGGSDFNPKDYSDADIMRFCHAFMAELYRHIGPDTDIPAGDIGVGEREVGYLFGAYKNLVGRFDGAMTGKNPAFGGSCVRKEATGYGCAYFLENVFQRCGEDLDGKVCVISGAGKVALYLADMLLKKGVKVVSLSDSKGMVHFLKGLSEDCLTQIIQIKEKEHGALEELCKNFDDCKYYDGERPWSIAKDTDVDIIIPAATQNEIDKSDAEILASNNIRWICEAANMPLTHDAQNIFKKNNVTILPSKAVNAGGVAVSGLERTQNAQYLGWSSEKVNQHLKDIMSDIHDLCAEHGQDQGQVNYSKGANIAGFERVAKAMMAYGTL